MDLDTLKASVYVLGIAALVLAAVAIATNELRLSEINSAPTSTVTNESITLANATAVSLANNWVSGVTEVLVNYAGTTWTVLATANYTVSGLNGDGVATVTLTNNVFNGNASRVTYNYKNDLSEASVNITNFGLTGTQNAASYFGTIGTLIGVAALLTVVLGAFYFARK